MSTPHLSYHRQPPFTIKKHSRISRSFNKLLRSVFRAKHNQNPSSIEGSFYVYDTSSPLSTIPEVPEFDDLSPDMQSLITRTVSDQFMSTSSLGVSCV
ncbi:hypothetical protein QVD17_28302 [Tagetes erecta]|uniref:Uncharacterized protein n=1 Tax=Tagetes erecta TaxID=13708 RepID=A0AAD8KAQ8_TARER|nr:hypothetical protein QVD17_28302 [Tagetes erecta]